MYSYLGEDELNVLKKNFDLILRNYLFVKDKNFKARYDNGQLTRKEAYALYSAFDICGYIDESTINKFIGMICGKEFNNIEEINEAEYWLKNKKVHRDYEILPKKKKLKIIRVLRQSRCIFDEEYKKFSELKMSMKEVMKYVICVEINSEIWGYGEILLRYCKRNKIFPSKIMNKFQQYYNCKETDDLELVEEETEDMLDCLFDTLEKKGIKCVRTHMSYLLPNNYIEEDILSKVFCDEILRLQDKVGYDPDACVLEEDPEEYNIYDYIGEDSICIACIGVELDKCALDSITSIFERSSYYVELEAFIENGDTHINIPDSMIGGRLSILFFTVLFYELWRYANENNY